MKNERRKNEEPVVTTKSEKKPYNAFRQMLEDKERIMDAIENDIPLSSLKGIKFATPLLTV
jgi:hypothetical protein